MSVNHQKAPIASSGVMLKLNFSQSTISGYVKQPSTAEFNQGEGFKTDLETVNNTKTSIPCCSSTSSNKKESVPLPQGNPHSFSLSASRDTCSTPDDIYGLTSDVTFSITTEEFVNARKLAAEEGSVVDLVPRKKATGKFKVTKSSHGKAPYSKKKPVVEPEKLTPSGKFYTHKNDLKTKVELNKFFRDFCQKQNKEATDKLGARWIERTGGQDMGNLLRSCEKAWNSEPNTID